MNILVEDRVKGYVEKHEYTGIYLEKKVHSFGWAGCRDIIQAEFLKDYSDIVVSPIKYKELDSQNGVRVFIPKYLNLEHIKEIRIKTIFSVFSKVMVLDLEMTEIE